MFRRIGSFLGGLLTGLLVTGLLWIFISEPRGLPVELQPLPSRSPLKIHVAGSVINPGVYTLAPGSITQDAIDAAGGLTMDAVLITMNLAAPLEDSQRIFIPAYEESSTTLPTSPPMSSLNNGEIINVNSATAPELESLPGIGPSLAQKIVDYRETYGPFLQLEDLLKVSGIGPAKFEQIQDLITLQ